jgi:hypothetical protein
MSTITKTEARVSTGNHTGKTGPYIVHEALAPHADAAGKLCASYQLINGHGYAVAAVQVSNGVIRCALGAAFVDMVTFRAEALQLFNRALRPSLT